ncbi:MAG: MDR family MFS transporter [Solirubrobacteraceae bacterium]
MTSGPALSHRQILVVMGGLMTGMLLAALDQTIVSTALPTIAGELHGLSHISYIITAYLLTSTVGTPLFGKISDLHGRKRVFQAAIVIFLIGSALSGVAQTFTQLILFRAIQGFGAGGLIAMTQTIIGDIVSPRERGRYQGYIGSVFALASVAGPLLGGFFVDSLSWRYIFYINIPLGLFALVVTSRALNLPFKRREAKIDYWGAALLVAGVGALLLVGELGGTQYAWGSATIIGLAALGLVLVGVFIWHERRTAEPILPPHLFRGGVFRVASAASFIVGAAMFGALAFLPLYLQVSTGASATKSGLLLLPLIGGLLVTIIGSGRLITRTGRYKVFPIVGTALIAVAMYLLSTLSADTSRLLTDVYMVVLGAGLGMVLQVLILAVQNAVPRRDLGVATAGTTFFRSLGGAIGTAAFGALLANRLGHELTMRLRGVAGAGRIDPNSLRGNAAQVAHLPPQIHHAVTQAVASSVDVVFLAAVPLAVIGFLIVLALKEQPLRETSNVGGDPGGPALSEPSAPEAQPTLV